MARVHRLEHVEGLGATNLADDDPVGPHAQGVADEVANGDLALALDVLGSALEPENMCLLQLQLGRVLDRYDSFRIRNGLRQRVQQRRLARARTAGDEDVELSGDAPLEKVHGLLAE